MRGFCEKKFTSMLISGTFTKAVMYLMLLSDSIIAGYFYINYIKSYDRGSVRLSGSKTEDRQLVYAALRAQTIENPAPAKINGHTACDSIDTVRNILYAYFRLGTVRNKISHADADAMAEQRLIVSESDVSSAMLLMRESIEFFILSYEKAMEEVRDKKPKIVAISPDDVRNAADSIRRGSNQGDRRQSYGKKQ